MSSTSPFGIERSLLSPEALLADAENICKHAIANADVAICVPSLYISKAKEYLGDAAVKVATIIGYPYGFSPIEAKLAEAVLAMVYGADELELAVNMTALKNNDWQYLAKEINTILPVVQAKAKTMKILVETDLLSDDELIKCCDLYGIAGIQFLSLSSGVPGKDTAEAKIALVRQHLAEAVGIKAYAAEATGVYPAHIQRLMVPFIS